MKRYLVALTLALLFIMAVGISAAYALPTSMTDSTGTSVNLSSANYVYNTKTGGGAEHAYSDRPADLSYGPHGKFTTDTNACGRCHQLHQAKSARLFRFDISLNPNSNNAIYGICTYCHNFNGQSTYDVKDGMIWDAANQVRYATNGGGFERQLVVEGPAALATLVKANSSHQVNRALNGSEYIRFNAPGGAANEHIALKCSSCHNPHGSNNARILVQSIQYYTASTGAASATRTAITNLPQFVLNRFANEQSVYPTQISTFCAACHTDYLNDNAANAGNAGSVLTGTNSSSYRHMINMTVDNTLNNKTGGNARNDGTFGYDANTLQLPLGTADANPLSAPAGNINKVVCTSCHFAHGTGAEMTKDVINGASTIVSTNSAAGQEYNLTTQVGGQWVETIKNLRMDNRAVCQNCHNRDSVDATAPALADVLDPAQLNTANAYSAAPKLAGVKAKTATAGSTYYAIIRFDQYMAKGPAETAANYQYDADGPGAGAAVAVSGATLMPDGRTVQLTVPSAPTAGTSTIATTTALKNINNIATAGQAVTIQ